MNVVWFQTHNNKDFDKFIYLYSSFVIKHFYSAFFLWRLLTKRVWLIGKGIGVPPRPRSKQVADFFVVLLFQILTSHPIRRGVFICVSQMRPAGRIAIFNTLKRKSRFSRPNIDQDLLLRSIRHSSTNNPQWFHSQTRKFRFNVKPRIFFTTRTPRFKWSWLVANQLHVLDFFES